MFRKGYTGKCDSMPGGLALGAITAVVISAIIAAGLAKMIDAQIMEWENIGYGIIIEIIGASFIGALVACIRIKRRYAFVCLMAGAIYFVILLSVCALFFGGQYEGVGVTGGLVAAGSGCAYLLKLSRNRAGRSSFKGKRFVKLYKK